MGPLWKGPPLGPNQYMRIHASITESLLSWGLGGYNANYSFVYEKKDVSVCGSVCVCVCALWHLLSQCDFIQKEAFFGIISDKRKGVSLHFNWFWCCFVAFPLADLNSTAQLHTSEAPCVKRAQHSWINATSNCWICVERDITVFTLLMITATVFPSAHLFLPLCSSLTASFHHTRSLHIHNVQYLQDLIWTEQLLSVMLILQIMIKRWSSSFPPPCLLWGANGSDKPLFYYFMTCLKI